MVYEFVDNVLVQSSHQRGWILNSFRAQSMPPINLTQHIKPFFPLLSSSSFFGNFFFGRWLVIVVVHLQLPRLTIETCRFLRCWMVLLGNGFGITHDRLSNSDPVLSIHCFFWIAEWWAICTYNIRYQLYYTELFFLHEYWMVEIWSGIWGNLWVVLLLF